jgi:hypothetical protein
MFPLPIDYNKTMTYDEATSMRCLAIVEKLASIPVALIRAVRLNIPAPILDVTPHRSRS